MSLSLAEVESNDTLPFVVDSVGSTDISSSTSKLIAPTIEEVDEDPEALRALRGEGRYFGVSGDDAIKEAAPKCNNCSQRGHLKKNCPHVICTYCGAMDDHYSKHCPKAIKCSNCNENGHYRSQCHQKWKKVYCTLCNSKRHARERCPSIWRVYLLKDDNGSSKSNKLTLPFDKLFCYNCGLQGHLGDDCNQRRSSRVPNDDGSAFSGDNLAEELKTKYFNNLNKQSRQSSRQSLYDDYVDNNDEFDYNDYEVDASYYDNNRNKSKKRKRSSNEGYENRGPKNIQPNHRGKSLREGRQQQQYNQNHPLDFPRGNNRNNNSVSNMNNARYGNASYGNNQHQQNYRNYNSYKPFRSGVLNMRR